MVGSLIQYQHTIKHSVYNFIDHLPGKTKWVAVQSTKMCTDFESL